MGGSPLVVPTPSYASTWRRHFASVASSVGRRIVAAARISAMARSREKISWEKERHLTSGWTRRTRRPRVSRHKGLAKELLTEAELTTVCHRQGFSHVSEIESCVLEPGGTFFMRGKTPSADEAFRKDVLERLDKEILIFDWHYRPDVSPESVEFFQQGGFEIIAAPSSVSMAPSDGSAAGLVGAIIGPL